MNNASLYTTRIQAQVMKERELLEAAYERYPDQTLFWCFVDLVDSANYRIAHGLKDGYIRGETFFSLVRAVIAPCADVRLVKEIGDSVLLAASSFRPILESVILVDQTAHQMADVAGTQRYPFNVRGGMGFGPAKRLTRRDEDFLGIPIDQLSRIMAIRSKTSNLLLQEEAYQPSIDILPEYDEFLSVGEPQMVPVDQSKGMVRPLYYRELAVDRSALAEFRDHFVSWRKLSARS